MRLKKEIEQENKKFKLKNKFYLFIIVTLIISIIFLIGLVFSQYFEEIKYKTESKKEYNENYHNASKKINFNSGYGSIQAYHPKIINFKEKWNGYKYWLVYTPYPYGNDFFENPTLVVSNDLVNWKAPEGLTNPIIKTPDDHVYQLVYNSDPHIVYNDKTDTLELYYRYVDGANDVVVIYRTTSKDGINWSKKEVILKTIRSEHDYLSPAVIYENGKYMIWYVDLGGTVKYIESEDGYEYTEPRNIILDYPSSSLKSWHLDVIKTRKGYEMITVAYKMWGDQSFMDLYYFNSKDNEKYSCGRVILRPSVNSWDNLGIYRSSFIYENGVYYLFYSAISSNYSRGTGLAYGKNIDNLKGYKGEDLKNN